LTTSDREYFELAKLIDGKQCSDASYLVGYFCLKAETGFFSQYTGFTDSLFIFNRVRVGLHFYNTLGWLFFFSALD
jgi:hypothetical protein